MSAEPGLKICKNYGPSFSGTEFSLFFLSPVLLGAKVSSNAFSCGKQGWIEGLTHTEFEGTASGSPWIRCGECVVKFLTKAGPRAPTIAAKAEPGWTWIDKCFEGKVSLQFRFLHHWISPFFAFLLSDSLLFFFGSLIVFRMLSQLSSFSCLFVCFQWKDRSK